MTNLEYSQGCKSGLTFNNPCNLPYEQTTHTNTHNNNDNEMNRSIDKKRVFDKTQHPFLIEVSKKTGN